MAIRGYIELEGDTFAKKRFRVLSVGHRPAIEKQTTVNVTVTGNVDVQSAPVLDRFQYTLKVYATDPESEDYGTKDDLETVYRIGTPPNNVLTLTETDDTKSHNVVMIGRLVLENKSPALSGSCAEFWADVEMVATS